MMKSAAVSLFVSMVVVALSVGVYHQRVIEPMRRVGVIDVAEVWKLEEKKFTDAVTRVGATDEDRQSAMDGAAAFARALPAALEELPRECACLVLVRSALAAGAPNTVDLTPALKRKLGLIS